MPVVTKPIPETSANVPETSTAKRPLKEAAPEAIKKQKTSEVEHVKKPTTNDEVKKIAGEDAKKMLFQRLFSEADEIALLQGLIDFTSTKGDPYEILMLFAFMLKKKFNNAVKNARKKGQTEDEVEYAKESEKKRFDLSIMIWGSNGVLVAGKSSKKKVAPKEMKPEETDAKVVNEGLSIGREMVPFGSSCGLDESKLTTGWENVEDGAEKREVEEKWKKFKDKLFELLYERSVLMNKTEAMMFKAES
ncbi:hypothetical protein [Arabidopsis thaliana]|nr:F6N15.6 gene product [Arabidopsis thaliana]CAB80771.1 hypothetical protein [Arabidopsis thaliana]